MTSFQKQVYDVVAEIPKGKTMTYAQVAAIIGKPGAARAVGTALGKNTDPKKVPCHRVIRSDGGLGGYRWGLKKKKEILTKEKAL